MNPGPAFWLLCLIFALGGLIQAVQAIIHYVRKQDRPACADRDTTQ